MPATPREARSRSPSRASSSSSRWGSWRPAPATSRHDRFKAALDAIARWAGGRDLTVDGGEFRDDFHHFRVSGAHVRPVRREAHVLHADEFRGYHATGVVQLPGILHGGGLLPGGGDPTSEVAECVLARETFEAAAHSVWFRGAVVTIRVVGIKRSYDRVRDTTPEEHWDDWRAWQLSHPGMVLRRRNRGDTALYINPASQQMTCISVHTDRLEELEGEASRRDRRRPR